MQPGDIGRAEKALQELIKDWERFFSGIRKTPPQNERDRLSRWLRRLAEHHQQSRRRADQFRVEQLQHRFMSYSQLWERLLREREEGRGRSIGVLRATSERPPEPGSQPEREQPTPQPNDSAPAPVDDSATGVAALYERYVAAKESIGQEVGVDLEAFAEQVAAQQESLESRFGSGVSFDVVVEGAKVKLAARKTVARSRGE